MKNFNRFILMLATLLAASQTALAAAPGHYYTSAYGKSDEALMTALRNIIYNHTKVSYTSGLLRAFAVADTDDDGYIIDIYSNCRYSTSDNGSSASHVGEGYNREHSFPRSWFGGEVDPMNTDVFHIYPTDIRVNSQRGNHPYGVCANGTRLSYGNYVAKGKLGRCTYPGYTGDVFEPDDEYKGDLARSYFYMVTCYKEELPSWPGSAQLDYAKNKYKAFSSWTINMLMEWTRLDPVSEKEIKRNEAVYGIQGNRNPFIDHPELAEYIWGDKQGEAWTATGEDIPAAITSPANGSTFDMGSTVVDTLLEYTIDVKGNNLNEDLTMTLSDTENFSVSKTTFSASEAMEGTTFTITFLAGNEGTFENYIRLGSDEASTTFMVTATAKKQGGGPGPDPADGDSITEDWEGCITGGYWTDMVEGNAFEWEFINAGIWGDNLCHGELSCRMGKTNSSVIAMAEDYQPNTAGISFWVGSFGNDADATLNVDYSTDGGATWTTLGTITATKGILQYYRLDADIAGPVRFRLAQTAGSRVNIDDITLYKKAEQGLKGDVNHDGEVTVSDVNYIIDVILQFREDPNGYADVNEDKEVTVADINVVIDIILGN